MHPKHLQAHMRPREELRLWEETLQSPSRNLRLLTLKRARNHDWKLRARSRDCKRDIFLCVCVHEDTLQHYMNIRNSEANEMKEKRTSVRDGCRKWTKIKVARKHIRRTWGQWIKRIMSHFILATGWLLHCANMCTRIYIHKKVCILLRYMCILLCYGLLAYV